ncbi:hypothetical protein FACS1894191_4510 [Clostridia bacterium]|nr:hypothetical protein FACS1894191_4510 [Clostridia bacterium]
MKQSKTRLLSFIMAVLMVVSFTVPAFAQEIEVVQDIIEFTDDTDSAVDFGNNGAEQGESPAAADNQSESDNDIVSPEVSSALGQSGEESPGEIASRLYQQWIDSMKTPPGRGGLLRAAPGDTGTPTHGSPIYFNPHVYFASGFHFGEYYEISIGGTVAFCVEPNGLTPSGSYTASAESSAQIKQILANYEAGLCGYLGAQIAIWTTTSAGAVTNFGGASSADYYAAINGTASTDGIVLRWTGGTQGLVTYDTESEPPDEPDDPPDEPTGDGNPDTHTETETETSTETSTTTEIRSDTEYEYSDALGQITIAKRDNEGKSLDGAIFNILVEFANGDTAGDSAFEIYNGSRLFAYTHPRDDHEPAKITVTEVRAPDGYIGDFTPKTATVHPTYTRITKVTTHTITITTTTVTTTVTTTTTDIESGEVLSEATATSSSSSDAETELNPPVVQEYVDFVEGDREITLTFVNVPKECSLTIYKHENGNKGIPLEGARFRIRYADANVSAQMWTLATDANGIIRIDLPFSGTLIIEELEAPDGYVIGHITSWDVVVAKGEHKQIDISNDKKAQIIVSKKDAQTGQLLAGAVIKATLLRSHTTPYQQGMVYTATTGADGKAVFNNMIPGEYRLEEQSPPQYYLGTDVVHTVSVFDGNTEPVSVIFENEPWTGLTIKKVDATNGKGLAGAVFKLYEGTADDSAKFLGDFQSNENGLVVIQNLKSDTYYTIKEAQPPFGYFLDAEHSIQTVLVKPEAIDKNLTVIFRNMPKPKLLITKIDEATGIRLPGAVFRVAERGSAEYAEVTTGSDGTVLLENMSASWYQVTEIRSPSGYLLDSTAHDIELIAGETAQLVVSNLKQPTLTIRKIDEQTGAGIEGVVLRVTKEGAMEYRDVTTGKDGVITLSGMAPGWVTIVEQKSKDGYILDATPHHIQLKPGEKHEITITNRRKPSLKIIKLDSVTKQPLQYVTFQIAVKNGASLGEYTTDAEGEIYLEDISPATYIISESKGRDGYIIADKSKEVIVEWGKLTTVEFLNAPKNPLLIKKIDSKTGEPLPGAVFAVTKVNGEYIGEYTTGRNGYITVTGVEPGFFTVREVKSPQGYILDDTPKTVELKLNQPAEVTFENKPLNGIQIHKVDAETREPLEGVRFAVKEKKGRFIGEFVTDANGLIEVPNLEPGWFQVAETAALPDYLLDSRARDVELLWNDHVLLEFANTRLSGLQVRKLDAVTGEPLQGVKFRLTKMNGEYVGDYVTGAGGYFAVSGLTPDWYTCYETAGVAGYVLDSTPQNIQIKKGALAVLEFTNKPLAGLQIKKVDAVTGLPLAGVDFSVAGLDGRRVGTFTTDDAGLIFVPDLREGWLVVAETKGLSGYKPDTAPRNVEIKADRLNVVEYRNQPYPFLQIKKVDSETGAPLSGVKFKIYDKNTRELGEFTTNEMGIIKLTGMEPDKYFIRESVAKESYVLDTTVHEVTLYWGKTTTIEVKNVAMSTLRLKKVDALTKQPLTGAVFLLYDAKNNILGEYTSDENGMIEFPRSLPAGKYKVKEVKAPEGYVLSDTPVSVELQAGGTTEIEIPNEPIRGKIQIMKKAADANTITKAKAGAALAGAVFEIVDEKLNLVDTITTNERGIAETKDLPLGKYAIQEVKSPEHYILDDTVFYGEIKLHGDVVRFEVLNTSSDISVTVEKRGNVEALTGDTIRYDFSNIANTSNISLEEFFWHDELPTDAVRLEKLFTGTWSERLKYRVVYRTNLKTDYRVWEDNLLTTQQNELNTADLHLAANEYVTDYRVEFGKVEPGFHEVEAPFILTRVLDDLPHEYRFVNETDVAGRSGSEWTYAKDSWVTVVFQSHPKILPRTGF